MKDYKKFSKIGQFKDIIRSIRLRQQFTGLDENGVAVYDETIIPKGEITFKGTVKLHGTNASVSYTRENDELKAGKRTGWVGLNGGHFGFADWVYYRREEILKKLLGDICESKGLSTVVIHGEWAGTGIQKKVGISEREKSFYAFSVWGIKEGEEEGDYLENVEELLKPFNLPDQQIFNVYLFETFEVKVDIQYPELAVQELDKLTLQVEEKCPACDFFSLTNTLGEGIVWRSGDIKFKTKGEKHSKGGGSKKMATIDPIKAANIKEFVEKTVTEDRLIQGYELLKEEVGAVTRQHTGDLIRWMNNDIIAEEGDALEYNNLERKDVGSAIANATKEWLFRKIRTDF